MKKSFISIIFSNFLLIFGVVSLLIAVDGYFYYAGVLILLAGVYHHFEADLFKFMALNLKNRTDTKEVNNPPLLLTFAVVPMLLIYLQFDVKGWGFLGALICLLFPIAGLYQLRKTKTNGRIQLFLLPLPLAGVTLTFLGLVLQGSPNLKFIMYIIMLGFSYLMIRPNS